MDRTLLVAAELVNKTLHGQRLLRDCAVGMIRLLESNGAVSNTVHDMQRTGAHVQAVVKDDPDKPVRTVWKCRWFRVVLGMPVDAPFPRFTQNVYCNL